MSISASQVKELRERTGAGFMDCKKALQEAEGDMEQAVEVLQRRQLAQASKKAGKTAAEGIVDSYIHAGGQIGVLVEVNCETDFVARNETFQSFVRDVCMHIAASAPEVVSPEDLSPEQVDRQREVFKGQAMEEGKPEHIAEKMVEGKLDKWKKQIALLEQPFVKDPDKTIGDLQTELTANLGEKVTVRRFERFEVGEGIEKAEEDFAEEVKRQAGF